MLHSPPLMSQTDHGRPSSSWEKNISIENSQAYLALPPHSFVISEFSSAMECFNNNNNMFGGANSSCAEPEFYESETKPKMISVDWDSPITAAEAVSPCAHGSSLSVGNSVDHKTTGIFIGKEDESLNSDSVKCKLTESHQTESAAPSYNQYASQGSEEESSWSTHPSRTHHGPLIMNTTSSQIKSSDTEIDGSRRTDAILNLREFPVDAAADRDQNWVRKRSPSRLKEDDQHPQKWTPIKKIARDVSLSTKNSTEETASIKRDPPEALNYGHMGSRNTLRVCVDCKTTKTPLWRSGPHGPKSLCNACGIRYRKARRALAACESAETSPGSLKCKPEIQERRLDKFMHYKKRSRFSIPSCKKNIVKMPVPILAEKHSHSPFQRVFAKDEEEAAVLLMALSCGLVHG